MIFPPARHTGSETLILLKNFPPLSDIIGGLLESGLRLDFLHEHETLPWRHFPMMVPAGERLYRLRPPDVAARVLGGRLKARLISFCGDKGPRQCDIAYETKRLLTEYVDDRPLRCFG